MFNPCVPIAFRAALVASASVAALASPSLAHADDDGAIAELVVTAERRAESILQVPIAVSAIAGEDFTGQHLAHMSDFSARIPNVEISSPRGNSLTDVVIRGVGIANDFSFNQASPVGLYLDDSYNAWRSFTGSQAFDLERVEVLRGPQGTLFGRNTTGGLINFITRRPGLAEDNGRVEAGYGKFNDVRLEGAIEHTFVPDVLGVRIAGRFQNHDGYYRNLAPGQPDVDDLDTRSGRIEVRWKPAPSLDITAKAYAHRDDNKQWNIRVQVLGESERRPTGAFDVDLKNPGDLSTSTAGAQLKAVANLGQRWTLTGLSSYDRGKVDIDGVDLDPRLEGTLGASKTFEQAHFRGINEEVRLNYDGERLRAVVGAYYGWDEVLDNARYDIFTVFLVSPRYRFEQDRRSAAAFAQIDYVLTPQLTLTGGLRFTHDSLVYAHGHADVGIPVVPGGVINTLPGAFSPLCPGLTCPDAEYPTLKGTNNAVTGRLAAKYAFADGRMVYASYNHGYRSGAYNGIAYLSPAQLEFVRPETVDAFEVGGKGRFLDGRAQLSVALFYNDYQDQQVNFVRSEVTALGPLPVSVLANVPKARTWGAEIEGQLQATDALRLHAAMGLLRAEYGKGAVVVGQSLAGKELPYSPHVSGSAGFAWTMVEVAGGEVVLAPTVVYSGHYYFDPLNVPDVDTDGFVRVNATLGWQRGGTAVRFWVNNLFNDKYDTYALDLSANTGNYVYVGAPPRTFGVSVSRDF